MQTGCGAVQRAYQRTDLPSDSFSILRKTHTHKEPYYEENTNERD
jgi:hypothetical protein